MARVEGWRLLVQQFKALLLKNLLLSWRRRFLTALHLTSSLFFILLIFGVDISLKSRRRTTTAFRDLPDPPAVPVDPILPCESGFFIKSPCYDFIWTTNSSSVIASIVGRIMQTNPGRVIPDSKVIGFKNIEDAEEWLLQNPLRCTGAIHMEERSPSVIAYGIQTNSTSKMERGSYEDPVFKFQLPLQLAAERAITANLLGGTYIDWNVYFKEFAHPPVDVFSVVAVIAPTFLLAASMFGFVIQMSNLVAERELKLRQIPTTGHVYDGTVGLCVLGILDYMGLLSCFYLIPSLGALWYDVWILLISAQQFSAPVVLIFPLSSKHGFISKSSSSKTVGFCIFIIGFLTQLVTYFGFPYNVSFAKSFQIIWSFFPPNLLAIALYYLGRATTNEQDPGISWENRKVCSFSESDCVLTMEKIFVWLMATFLLWLLSAIYIDNVLPVNGVRKPWLYFLKVSYWTGASTIQIKDKPRDGSRNYDAIDSSIDEKKDEDVRAEENSIKTADANSMDKENVAIQVRGLMKTFTKVSRKGLCWKKTDEHHAVKGLWINIKKDSLFCLLGQNGAGKSTTISCITGVLPISGGDVLIYGDSITSPAGMNQIRSHMGVCPQFDVLWDNLSGLEHLHLFAQIKGLHPSHIVQHSMDLMEHVKLTEAMHVQAGNYSGGMKRRLSVAIALIGDPKIVCLDEPTTGMDPVTRRHVWNMIEEAKVGRAIILTTHSMEEADILGDRIAIMTRGVMRCIGTPIRLKSRYGSGYIINVMRKKITNGYSSSSSPTNHVQREAFETFFKEQLNVAPKQENEDFITFIIPYDRETQLPDIFTHLQAKKDELGFSDIHVSLTTLEDIFIHVVQQTEADDANTEKMEITEGTQPSVVHGDNFDHITELLQGEERQDAPPAVILQELEHPALSSAQGWSIEL
ncbi:hypothetical protein KP509_35G030600 [Ceratopteris richardii]|uniref:ABC transporter domain-containing protein n=1 Tax=Ceratopteris richardii TaxID=49495 RepID=A0A8T2QFT2_CERRI|nr:hypothetical protein KP509_35G030600 [Ceratopteris richardii]